MERFRRLARAAGGREGLALSALGALVLLLAWGGGATRAARGEEGGEPVLCGRPHPSRGESAPLDLAALERSYAALKSSVSLRLGEIGVDPERPLRKPVDLGIARCRGRNERRTHLEAELPAAFRKATLFFLRGSGEVPEAAAKSPDAEILLVSADGLRRVSELSRTLGKRVTLAPPRLVDTLGVRCTPTRVAFSEDGNDAILVEGE
jgi:hypothetical protein